MPSLAHRFLFFVFSELGSSLEHSSVSFSSCSTAARKMCLIQTVKVLTGFPSFTYLKKVNTQLLPSGAMHSVRTCRGDFVPDEQGHASVRLIRECSKVLVAPTPCDLGRN